jgi:protein O-mannosyl-transferase
MSETGAPTAPASRGAATWVPAAVLVAAGLIAYANSFSAPFLFDDRAQVTENPTIHHLGDLAAILHPPADAGVGGRPLLNLSFAINYAISGTHVWSYHALNLAIHIAAALVLFGILRRLCPQGPSSDRTQISGFRFQVSAFVISLLWTIHPLQTEAVTYVAERAESLMGLFYLLTVYCFIRYTENPSDRSAFRFQLSGFSLPLPTLWGCLSVTACLLGALTKEVIVTAPLVVLLYDRTFVAGSFREAFRRRGRLYAGYLASWLLVGLLVGDVGKRGVGFGLGGSWLDYALGEGRIVLGYLGLAFWPHPLVFDRGMGVPKAGIDAVPSVLAVLVLAGAAAWALLGSRTARPTLRAAGFAGAWFFLILAPTSSVVAVAGQPMAEHRMYLPLAAVIGVAVVGVLSLVRRLPAGMQRVASGLALAALVGPCLALTIARNDVYRSEVSIWENTVAGAPGNARAENALGLALAGEGNRAAAITHYRRAIAMEPRMPQTHQNLGAALLAEGDARGAVAECSEALRLRPSSGEFHRNLAVALRAEGDLAQAELQFREALKERADDGEAWAGLGATLVAEGASQRAILPLENAVRLAPGLLDARYNLANALLAEGDSAGAIGHYRILLRATPSDVAVLDNLAIALAGAGQAGEAESLLRQAIALAPGRADLRCNLASVLERLGRPDEARGELERVLVLEPGNGPARERLAQLRGEGSP